MPSRPSWLSLWAPVLVLAVLLFALSHQSTLPLAAPGSDLVAHGIAYCFLGLLALRAFHGRFGPLRVVPTFAAVALTVAYGASDEWHQSFVPGRTMSLADLGADTAGALIACGLVAVVARLRGNRPGGGRSAAA